MQERRVINFVTPESATSARYFWCIARDCDLDDDAISADLLAKVQYTFDQDEVLLEAQQRTLGGANPLVNVTIKVDAGPSGRRLMSRLAAGEPADTVAASGERRDHDLHQVSVLGRRDSDRFNAAAVAHPRAADDAGT